MNGHWRFHDSTLSRYIFEFFSQYAKYLRVYLSPDSNTGFDVLGWALQNFASSLGGRIEGTEESYLLYNLLNRDVFQPLGMNSSFFHPIPEHLKSKMTVPRSDHMVDLDFGEAYDP